MKLIWNAIGFVLGNDIASKAAQSGNISPWPDGARVAKIAWERELGSDGLFHSGRFVQPDQKDATQRAEFILNLKLVVLP